jgi:hypothetical protein
MTTKTFTAEAEIDVSLSEFDDDDIVTEYESRGLGSVGDFGEQVHEMFYAFYFGKAERAIEIARQIAQDHTGRILP